MYERYGIKMKEKMKKCLLTVALLTVLISTVSCNTTTTQTPVSSEITQSSTPDITATTAPATDSKPTQVLGEYLGAKRELYYTVNIENAGTIEGEAKQTLRGKQPSSEVTAVANEGYDFLKWSDGVTDATRSADVITVNPTYITAIFVRHIDDFPIPVINITTDTGNPILSKVYETATIKVEGTKNGKHDGVFTTKIRGRGNSSWNASASQESYESKNSYRLKLDESQKFLGIGDSKNRDWVLNSCKFDASLLRNWLGYTLGSMLDGISYSSECTWADVYINGVYRGVYMVTELIEVASDRVEVDDNTELPDNGFLIELDMRGNSGDAIEGVDYFYIDGYAPYESNAREWVIKSDLSEDPEIAAKQFEFIKEYIEKVHAAIESGVQEDIEELVDIRSFVDMFIISEFTKDVDVNTASFFMSKAPGEKLQLTAPWDFDFGFGTYYHAVSFYGFITQTSSGNQWFQSLTRREWFIDLVVERMNEIDPLVNELIEKTVSMGYKLEAAANRNHELWGLWGVNYHKYVSSSASTMLDDYDAHIDFLMSWMTSRWEVMKEDITVLLTD